jgi:hypothetical protein
VKCIEKKSGEKNKKSFVPLLIFLIICHIPLFTVPGNAIDIQGMIKRTEIVQLTGRADDVMDAGVTELDHISCLRVDKMVVLTAVERFFILGNVPAKLVFDHKIAAQEQLDRVVQRGTTHLVILVLHRDVQRLDIEMTVGVVDLFQDGKPFGGFAVSLFFQIILEDFFYRLLRFGI